ncbi:hypothetical protein SB00610_03794 [Klebsiella quasipneumoniae subsp. similipneumoniae]|mgnify:FL=1|nr:hypothetical protein SB00610_03794 [Klebsiella quasipneumoniae subsp. similipneumoniae]
MRLMIRALWLVEKGDGKTTMNEVRWPATAEAYLLPIPRAGAGQSVSAVFPWNKFAGLIRHQRFHHFAGIRVRLEGKVPFHHQQNRT